MQSLLCVCQAVSLILATAAWTTVAGGEKEPSDIQAIVKGQSDQQLSVCRYPFCHNSSRFDFVDSELQHTCATSSAKRSTSSSVRGADRGVCR